MAQQEIKIGINGFGRIGRAVVKILSQDPRFQVVLVNDITEDINNLAYLYNYDSVYGRTTPAAVVADQGRALQIEDQTMLISCERSAAKVPWADLGVDIIIDSSGVRENIDEERVLVEKGYVKKVIVTHSPTSGIDRYIVMGVNDDDYKAETDHVVSSSICDANAIGHMLKAVDHLFGIETGSITTLHPWLSYQNLVDGPLINQSRPGHNWPDFSLGRSSINTLIPKETTAVRALEPVMGDLPGKLASFSYRIPTSIVSSADINLFVAKDITSAQLVDGLKQYFDGSPYVTMNEASLTSIDYVMEPWSCVIDSQWTKVHDKRLVKLIVWYDNEWAYSSRVKDVAALLAGV